MKKKYFTLQLKSVFKVYPMIICLTLITILSIATACFFITGQKTDTEEKQKISIGIVGDLEDSYLKIGLYALQNMDNSRFYIDFINYTEENAKKALNDRKISGYVLIPENYVNSILQGRNQQAKYITLNAPHGFGTIISSEVAELVSHVVTESQKGMYSMQDVAQDYNNAEIDKKIEKLTLSYVNFLLSRNDIYEIETFGVADSLSFAGYYICGFLILFLLLWGIAANRIFTSKNPMYSRVLKIAGINPSSQILCEYTPYLIVSLVTLLLFAGLFGIMIQFINPVIIELSGVSIWGRLGFIIKILPVIVMITMMHTAFYELIPNTIGSVLMQFLLAIGLGYVSGCFYPNYFFPEAVQNFVYFLPVGVGFSYVRKAMTGGILLKDFFIVLIYIISFFLITSSMRKYKITGDIK